MGDDVIVRKKIVEKKEKKTSFFNDREDDIVVRMGGVSIKKDEWKGDISARKIEYEEIPSMKSSSYEWKAEPGTEFENVKREWGRKETQKQTFEQKPKQEIKPKQEPMPFVKPKQPAQIIPVRKIEEIIQKPLTEQKQKEEAPKTFVNAGYEGVVREPADYKKMWKTLAVIAGIACLLAIAIYFTFYYNPVCEDFGCFKEMMSNCKRAGYVNDQSGATWRYDIAGKDGDYCSINVKLLQIKEGNFELSSLEKKSMTCEHLLGVATYPEKDLDKCHGELKEAMQGVVIEKLHSYVIENLGVIDVGLNG
jgi:hypothetical protein